jgi:hypothetical protein
MTRSDDALHHAVPIVITGGVGFHPGAVVSALVAGDAANPESADLVGLEG